MPEADFELSISLPTHLKDRPEIQTIINCLKTHPIVKAYLFGSMARNEATHSSDIDLLVTVDPKLSFFEFIKIQQKLESELNRTIDMVSDEGLSVYIAPYINQDKVLRPAIIKLIETIGEASSSVTDGLKAEFNDIDWSV